MPGLTREHRSSAQAEGVFGEFPLSRRCFLSGLAVAAGPGIEPVSLTLAGVGYQAAEQLGREGLDEFTRNTGIKVELVPTWGTSRDQLALTLRMLNKQSRFPDVYLIDVIWPGTLQQYLLDLTPYLDGDAREQLPELMKNDTINGRLVSLPFYVNVGMLYYRTDLLKKYGYRRPPDTWDELEKMAANIQRGERRAGHRDFWGYVWQGSAYEGLMCNALEWEVSFGGGRIVEADGRVSVNNPHTAKALRKAAGWVGWISPPSVLSYTETDTLTAFRLGNAAFMRYWSSGYSPNRVTDPAVRGRFNASMLPAGPYGRAETMGGFELAVSRYSAHPREAVLLVRYLTGPRVQKRRALDGYLPTIPRLYSDPEVLEAVPQARPLRDAGLASWVARPSSVVGSGYAEMSKCYYEAVHSVLSHQRRPEEALETVERELTKLMSNAGVRQR